MDVCDTAVADCDPYPDLCDLPDIVANNPDGEMLEDFEDGLVDLVPFFPQGAGSNATGWWLSTNNQTSSVPVDIMTEYDEINDPGHATPLFRFLRIGIDGNDCVDPLDVNNCNMPTNGSSTWFIEGPGYFVPLGRCFESPCDTTTWRAPWGAYALEMSLRINSDQFPPNSQYISDAATYEILVLDPFTEDEAGAVRVHLRVRSEDKHCNAQGCQARMERAYVVGTDPFGNHSVEFQIFNLNNYQQNDWFKLQFTFNASDSYSHVDNYGCLWTGGPTAINYFHKLGVLPTERVTKYQGNEPFEELGAFVPEQSRGVQVRITTNNKVSGDGFLSTLDIGDIRIYPITHCEWFFGHPCAIPECICRNRDIGTGVAWQCGSTTNFGNVYLELGDPEYEQCEPPDQPECDDSCSWICGDGIVQSDVDSDGDTVYDHCEEMGWPAELCGPGTEQCDDGNNVSGDGCENDCTLTP